MTTTAAPLPGSLDPAALTRAGGELAGRARAGVRLGRALLLDATPAAQLARYTLVGAVTSLLYALVFVALETTSALGATVAAATASTVVANELHRRLTFHAAATVGFLAGQLESGGLALVAIAVSALATTALGAVVTDPSTLLRITVVLGATGAVGLAKFAALRGVVFARGR
ncbi:hypothetical protein GCM10027047_02830 [Rhodococcus aerolatus]